MANLEINIRNFPNSVEIQVVGILVGDVVVVVVAVAGPKNGNDSHIKMQKNFIFVSLINKKCKNILI